MTPLPGSVEQATKQANCNHHRQGSQGTGRYCDACGLWWPLEAKPRMVAIDALILAVRADLLTPCTEHPNEKPVMACLKCWRRDAQAEPADITNARLAMNDFHACSTQDELDRWRTAQLRLIVAAKASVYPEVLALQQQLASAREQVEIFMRAQLDAIQTEARITARPSSARSQGVEPMMPKPETPMTPEQKIATAKRLLFEATRAIRRREQLARAADRCQCGHRRDEHAVSHSINYTEGYCMVCPEKHHHSVCQWFNLGEPMTPKPETPYDDEPGVIGAGCGIGPMPTKAEAEAVWRAAYVARMVERGVHVDDAQACCDAGDADLSVNPADAADDQLEYWNADEA